VFLEFRVVLGVEPDDVEHVLDRHGHAVQRPDGMQGGLTASILAYSASGSSRADRSLRRRIQAMSVAARNSISSVSLTTPVLRPDGVRVKRGVSGREHPLLEPRD
jgi:hypothetical protein